MVMLPSFYKLDTGRRSKPCFLCLTRTEGPTVEVYLGFGQSVCLCEGHASEEFRRQRGGRDFYLSLSLAFTAAGCYTVARQRALRRIFEEKRQRSETSTPGRARPGSYAWPNLRALVEDACHQGVIALRKLRALLEEHLRAELRRGRVRLPSDRTLRRWRLERRWADDSAPT